MTERRSKARVIDLEIYTDGSVKKYGNQMTFGGWAFISIRDGQRLYGHGGNMYDTTNQRMELMALVEALKYAASIRRPHEKVIIYSDSAYIINCYQQDWYINWENNGWLNANKKPVANQDLWRQIVPYFDHFWYSFRKVPAHSGVHWNEECDHMAQYYADTLKQNWRGTKNESRNI